MDSYLINSTIRIRTGSKYLYNHEDGFVHAVEITQNPLKEEGIAGNKNIEWKIECTDFSAQVSQIENPLKVNIIIQLNIFLLL